MCELAWREKERKTVAVAVALHASSSTLTSTDEDDVELCLEIALRPLDRDDAHAAAEDRRSRALHTRGAACVRLGRGELDLTPKTIVLFELTPLSARDSRFVN
jgi:hypothetical protein